MLLRDPGQMWGEPRLQRPPDPWPEKPSGQLKGGPCQEVSPTSWKMQQSSGKQQETALETALRGLISRDFCPSCCQQWEIMHRGQGMMWQRDQVSFGKVIFQFKYHSVTEIFWNPTRLRVRLNYPELLPAIGLGVRRGQMGSDLVHNLLSSRGSLPLWASEVSSSSSRGFIFGCSPRPLLQGGVVCLVCPPALWLICHQLSAFRSLKHVESRCPSPHKQLLKIPVKIR